MMMMMIRRRRRRGEEEHLAGLDTDCAKGLWLCGVPGGALVVALITGILTFIVN